MRREGEVELCFHQLKGCAANNLVSVLSMQKKKVVAIRSQKIFYAPLGEDSNIPAYKCKTLRFLIFISLFYCTGTCFASSRKG